ncbi:hypothetical protein [Moritella sp. F3]|uniref:hypothetical protein n=1 Tax=Moritella sp. F3 TaxID=2718882 RepID=UPI0018E106D5|nr:hypothetical protein [Moritella sp. F3]GIC77662.1 hypothetical protein FMO001_23890 [Moritella sp. F1]GIC82075.1 hypothetical protein FMO003_23560 [Moritella sp. F3]
MLTVRFINVGFSNANFERQFDGVADDMTEEFILGNAKEHCGSRDLEALLHEDGERGIIMGGLRQIGEFEFVESGS